jgi:hypothetical protein
MAASEIIFVVDESSEGGFEARALSRPIYTQADTFDALKEMVRAPFTAASRRARDLRSFGCTS